LDTPPEIVELIAEAKKNPENLGLLLERYRAFLLLRGHQRLNPKVAARSSISDIIQNTFADVLGGFEQFRGSTEVEFSAWLQRVHDNNLLDAARRAKADLRDVNRQVPLGGPESTTSFFWREPAADQTSPSQQAVRGERALALAEIIEKLPDMQREAVRLRHLEGWTLHEIAEELGKSEAATAGLIKRGLQALRKSLSDGSWL
jgi:RNA polymerase sigma-70 factor (ECF subfamily)